VKDATGSVLVNEVYKDYCDWCAEQNIEEPFKIGHFGTALKAALPTIAHRRDPGGDRKYRYYGIRRKTEAELNPPRTEEANLATSA